MEKTSPFGTSSSMKLTLAALGVVFGDIGTSPLYALRASLGDGSPTEAQILGTLSLIFWGLIIVVTIKYTMLVTRTLNNGEGGILALTSLSKRHFQNSGKKVIGVISLFGIIGASLLYSDGIITPAISVLSAVEGLGEFNRNFLNYSIPLALLVIVALFAIQSRGTGRVGAYFGPIILLWFTVLAIFGSLQIFHHFSVLKALNPYWAIYILSQSGWHSLLILGGVFLTMTGAEVMYADIGHFGRKPIVKAWSYLVFPSLILNYFGQGAYLLAHMGQPVGNIFFQMLPNFAIIPMVILATLATVIASQAVFTGAFSLAKQAMQLGMCPRLEVKHTSEESSGQIFVPFMNWLLLIGIIILVVNFKESSKLASAYGIAIALTMLITTLLMIYIKTNEYKSKRAWVWMIAIPFLLIDLVFISANLPKLWEGGWVVALIAFSFFILMHTWIRGRNSMGNIISKSSMPLDSFVKSIGFDSSISRVPDVAVFLTSSPQFVPRALLHNLKHNKVLHEKVVILNVQTLEVPHVPIAEQYKIQPLANQIYTMTISYGFKDSPSISNLLFSNNFDGLDFHPLKTTFFLGRDVIVIDKNRKTDIPYIMKRLYKFMTNNALSASDYYHLPSNRVVEMGGQNDF